MRASAGPRAGAAGTVAGGATGFGPELANDLLDVFAARLRGPAEARAAVLAALAEGAPYPLARIAAADGRALGVPASAVRRLAALAEVVRAALRVCAAAVRQDPLGSRPERAMRVLVADTLLTFAHELAADLPEIGGGAVRALLARTLGAAGPLGELAATAAADGHQRAALEREPDRAASTFLDDALRALAAAGPATHPHDVGPWRRRT
ncbi:MAG TPA: hypothetical protein VIC59_02130 [Gemmatimonadota bacterium]